MTADVEDRALTERIKAQGRELGFARVGIARAEALGVEAERLRAWLDAGYHGTMAYMERTAAVRADPTHAGMLASARSVIVLAALYESASARRRAGDEQDEGTGKGRVARYARGRDYHNVLHKRLRPLLRQLRQAGHEARASVDSMPVFERAWAQRAGVGFIGKNCCLIVPGIGSHVFLTAVVTSAVLCPDQPMRERCGECTLCLDGCPTRAFVSPRVMDARRCISYVTIEHGGAIDPELRPLVGDRLFGCDVCQDVCPWNRASPAEHAGVDFGAASAIAQLPAEDMLALDEAQFAQVSQGSPMRRPRREGLARNAAIALGNARTRRALPVLRDAARGDPSQVVREAAQWAASQIEDQKGEDPEG